MTKISSVSQVENISNEKTALRQKEKGTRSGAVKVFDFCGGAKRRCLTPEREGNMKMTEKKRKS